jgi:HK97 gp10 family phage protein
MSDITVKIDGVPEVLKAIERLTPQLRQRLQQSLLATGLDCQTDARRNCPVGTPESTHKPGYHGGRLRASIRMRQVAELVVEVFTDVFYGIFLEEGTRRGIKPHHFMRDAYNINAAKLREKIKTIFQASGETSY